MNGYHSLKELPNADPRTQSKAGFLSVEAFFSGSFFQIPGNQRPYVWEKKQVDDLLDDILKSDGHDRYFGSIVLTSNGPVLDIVDGQQRITTFSLLAMAFRDLINDREIHTISLDALEAMHRRCESILGASSFQPRLGNSNLVFQELLAGNIPFAELKAREADKGKKSSGFRILTSYEQIRHRIIELEVAGPGKVSSLFEGAFTTSKLVCIIFSDPTQANQLFESLNARGKPLSPADNVKNDLVAAISNNMREHAALRGCIELWNDITGDIEILQQELGESGVPSVTEFMHLFTLAHSGRFSGQARLKKSVEELLDEKRKREGQTKSQVSKWYLDTFRNTVRGIRDLALSNCAEGLRIQSLSSELRNKYGYLWYIAAYQMSPWTSILSLTSPVRDASILAENFAIHFKVSQMKLGVYQKRIHRSVVELMHGVKTFKTVSADFYDEFDREEFLRDLGHFDFSEMKFAHFVLNAIEESIAKNPLVSHGRLWSVEHVVPQNPKKWGMMGAAVLVKHKRIVNRLGNLTLITASSNSHLSNKSLEFKLAGNRNGMCSISGCLDHYIDSPYQLTKRIATSYPDLMEEFVSSKIASSETATLRWCFEFIEQRTSELIDLIEASNLWGFKG